MTLFIQRFTAFWILFAGLFLAARELPAQTCSPFPVYFPDTVCLGQTVQGINAGPAGNRYTWNTCAGDLFLTGAFANLGAFPNGTLFNGARFFRWQDKIVGLAVANNNGNLSKVEYDTLISAAPVTTSFGNPDNALVSPNHVEVLTFNGLVYAFTQNRTNEKVVRMNFTQGLSTAPSTNTFDVTGVGNCQFFTATQADGRYMTFSWSPSGRIFILDFSTNPSGTPTLLPTVAVPNMTVAGMRAVSDCSGKYLFFTASGNKLIRLAFGNSYANPNPVRTDFNLPGVFTQSPNGMSVFKEGGRSGLLLSSPQLVGRVIFGGDFGTNLQQGLVTTGSLLSVYTSVSEPFYMANGKPRALVSISGGNITTLSFSGTTCTSSLQTQYNPPVFVANNPGKNFINYWVRQPDGTVTQYGDSVFVKSNPGTGASARPDFFADEQCTARLTRFFPNMSPAGTYTYGWTFHNNTTSTQTNPTFQYSSAGSYPVTIRYRSADGCNAGSFTKNISIVAGSGTAITSDFAIPAQVCTRDSVQFNDGSTPAGSASRWKWDFGGQVFFTKNPKVVFPQNLAGQNVQVSLKATDSTGCGNPVTKPVPVSAGADLQFSFSQFCEGLPTQISNNTPNASGISFQWNFGDPGSGAANTSTNGSPTFTHLFSDSGAYTVKLRGQTANGCVSQAEKSLRIYAKPRLAVTYNPVVFPGNTVQFSVQAIAPFQTISQYSWNFGDPGSGAANTSSLANPSHVYAGLGSYPVQVSVQTNQSCSADTTVTLNVYSTCPTVTLSKSDIGNGDFDTTRIQFASPQTDRLEIDFCAGDLELTPVLQSQQSGAQPIANASQVMPIFDGGKWTGFIPAPISTNGTALFKADIGSNLNNDISNFSSSLGTLQNRLTSPSFVRFIKKDSIWYAFASNGDSKLWRFRFGQSLNTDSPVITEIVLPTGTLATAAGAQIALDKDTTYLFILNNNNQPNNNVVRLRFSGSLDANPDLFVLNNPLVLQNSNGFLQLGLGRECGNWFGLLLANSQLYRLNFGNSLSNTPTAVSLTGAFTAALGSANAFNNLRGVNLLRDLGRWYAFVNTSTGSIIRARFRNGLGQEPDEVKSLGNFGIAGTVGTFHFARQESEFFGFTINNQGTVYKIKFPNQCPASKAYALKTSGGADTVQYFLPGKYFITTTSTFAFGASTQVVDSVEITAASELPRICRTTEINMPASICSDYSLNPFVSGGPYRDSKWDFCNNDFQLPPSNLANPIGISVAAPTCLQVVENGGIYYLFTGNAGGLFRSNLGNSLDGIPTQPNTITISGATGFTSMSDLRVFKEGNQWYALCTYLNGEIMVRLNFGTNLTNNNPGISLLNLPGYLARARGLELFEDQGSKYAMIANQDNGTLTLLNFGSTYRNIPIPFSIDVPSAVNLYRVRMIRECNIWHAFVSDQAQDSVYHLIFRKGLYGTPSRKMLPVVDGISLNPVKDGPNYFLFVTKTQTNSNNIYKFSFGRSLENTPGIDSLGNFAITTPATGILRLNSSLIYKDQNSNNVLIGLGADNGQLYRIKFQNNCGADKPVASGDTVSGQVFRNDGKYYVSFEGYNAAGEYVTALDSINIQDLVDADFSVPGNRCKGQAIVFNDVSITAPNTSITNWYWKFNDANSANDSSNLANPSHIFPQAGTYQVRLIVREQNGCFNEITRSVVVADKPRPDFIAGNGGTLCTNDSITFTNQSTTINDPVIGYQWKVSQGGNTLATSSRQNPKFLFTSVGTYQVELKVTGQSLCDSTLVRNVVVGAEGANVTFSNASACLNEEAVFVPNISSSVAPDSVKWFIDASSYNGSVGTNFVYTFNQATVYTVRLTSYNQSCANSFSKVISVNARPTFIVDVQAPLPCQGLPVTFTNNLSSALPVKYLWDFGDNTSDTLKSPTKIFQESGTYLVRLKVTTENGCEGSDTLSFTARRSPKAFFSIDKACKDEPVTFTNQSTANGIPGGITSYFWEFGTSDGLTSTAENPGSILYNEPPGVKTVRLTVRTAEDCPNTFTLPITIGPKLAANFRKVSGCIGTPFQFFDITNSGIDTIRKWNWSIGGLNYTSQNPVVELTQMGTYDVRLRVESKSGCVDEVTRTAEVTVLDAARADFSVSGNLSLPPFTAIFKLVPGINNSYVYEWNFGDSTQSSSPEPPPHIYNQEGAYIVTLRATRAETVCSTVVQKVVNVISNPIQGLRVKNVTIARGSEKIAMAVEIENQSNIAQRSFSLQYRVGNLITGSETWNGILMPGASTTYTLRSELLTKVSQRIPYICISALLTDPSKETSPEDNTLCQSLDSISSLASVFPNPAGDDLNLDLSLANTDPVEIRIHNSIGQEVMFYRNEEPAKGALRKTFDIRHLPNGMYYVWFRSGTTTEYRKVAVQRN